MRGRMLVRWSFLLVLATNLAWGDVPAPAANAAKAPPQSASEAPKASPQAADTALSKAQQAAAEKKAEEEEAARPYGKANPLIPFIQFGPKLNLIIFPALGLEVKAFNYVSASFDYLYVPTITVSGLGAGMNAWWLGLRGHPIRGSFFLGADLYALNIVGSTDYTINLAIGGSETRNISMTAATMGVTPMLGWRWVTRSGFFTVLELGAMITFASSVNPAVERKAGDTTSFTTDGPTMDSFLTDKETLARNQLTPLANLLRQYPLPHIRFAIGFLF